MEYCTALIRSSLTVPVCPFMSCHVLNCTYSTCRTYVPGMGHFSPLVHWRLHFLHAFIGAGDSLLLADGFMDGESR